METEDVIDAINAVSVGEADALFSFMALVNYYLNKYQITNLKVGGDIGIGESRLATMRMAVSKENEILASILDKGIPLVSDEEYQAIHDRWFGAQKPSAPTLTLTAEEQRWLAQHPVVRVHNEKDWRPFNYNTDGQPQGYSIAFCDLLAEKIGFRAEYIAGKTWDEYMQMIRDKELDVMLNIARTEERGNYILFTDPYLTIAPILYSREGTDPVSSIEDLFGSAAVVNYYTNMLLVDNLQLGGRLGIDAENPADLRLGVRDDWRVFQAILQKGIDAVTEEERGALESKWLSRPRTGASETGSKAAGAVGRFAGRRIIIIIAAVFVVLSFGFWLVIRATKGKDIVLNFGSKQFRWLTLAGLSAIITVVVLLGLLLIERNRRENFAAAEASLVVTLENAEARLGLWIKQNKSYLERLGRDPELTTLVSRLLRVDPDSESLLRSSVLAVTRMFFQDQGKELPNIGFFIISPENISIGSRRDANVGIPNLIADRRPDLIERAFQGEVLFVPPMESDVSLSEVTGAEGEKNPPTMFFLGPVRKSDGSIIAVMTLRVDPTGEFSRALQFDTARASSDTYAISRNGLLLS